MLVALAHQLHDLGLHHRSADDGDGAIDVDDRRDAERGVDIAGAEATGDGDDGMAVD